jgi:signal transduction histidine kinase/CHASE3 domain sensor protein
LIRLLSIRAKAAMLLVAVLAVVTGVFAGLAVSGQAVADASTLAERTQAFDDANLEFRTGLADQESGVRGYGLSGDPVFLAPYESGRATVASTLKSLKAVPLPNTQTLLTQEERDAAAWQAWAQARVVAIRDRGPGPSSDDLQGKRLFDQFRTDWERLDSFGNGQRINSGKTLSDELSVQRNIRLFGWLLVLASLVGLGALIFFAILRPLLAQADVVATLDGSGTLEIPGLGRRDEIGRLAAALKAFQETLGERASLAHAMTDVGAESDLDRVVGLAADRIADLVDAEDGTVALVTGEIRHIVHSKSGVFAPGMVVETTSPGTRALASAHAVEMTAVDLPDGAVKDAVIANGYGPILIVPLISGGEAVGTLNALRKSGRPAFDDVEIRRAEFIAPFVATAVKAARLIRDLREANSVKSRFLANMSHELRTPLNAILGFSQVLSAEDFGPLNDRQQRYTGYIENSGRLLLDLINDILDLAKVEAGLMHVTPEPIEVGPVVLESRSHVERQAEAKGITLVYQMTPGLWAIADSRRLQQVVLNLLSNAVKFTQEGGSVVVASSQAEERVAITVTDTGIGIAPEEQGMIFDEFAQSDNVDSREQKGTGLGLSLSRKLTELMNGTLTLTSQLGRGSSFTIALAPATARPATDGPLVMIVEDEAPNRELLVLAVEHAGFRSLAVSGVATALRALDTAPPAAVLLDIELPDGDGWAVLDVIIKRPVPARIPVIAVTAMDDPPARYRDHLAAFMTKPVDRDQLISELNRVLLSGAVTEEVGPGD